MIAPTQIEAPALERAMQAFESHSDRQQAVLAAGRAFRDALPPRKLTDADHRPDPIVAGQAARRVLDAADRGVLHQSVRDILIMTGRALVEAAYPSRRLRNAQGKPDLEAAGRAADEAYDKADRRKSRPKDRALDEAVGKAGLAAAWGKLPPRPRTAS